MARTSPGHLEPKSGMGSAPRLQYRIPAQSSIDGNTVESDVEVGQFSDNAIRLQASLSFTSQNIRALQTALAGQ